MRKPLQLALLFLLAAPAFATTPVCLYQDVLSMQAGGYVDVFGQNFGSSQGTSSITINGTAVTNVIYWGTDVTGEHEQIGFQVPTGTTGSGNIVVTVGGNSCGATTTSTSNALPFTVRSGNIWYIGAANDQTCPMYGFGTTGSNGSCGSVGLNCTDIESQGGDHATVNSYSNPWGLDITDGPSVVDGGFGSPTSAGYGQYRTPSTYLQCISAGDTVVFLNGINYPYYSGTGWHSSLYLSVGTTSSTPITLMAYPGATATFGGTTYAYKALTNETAYSPISGLTLIGAGGGNAGESNRMVNNHLECPTCSASTATLEGGNGNLAYGNWISDSATSLAAGSISKTFHAIYFNGSNIEIAWNRISNYQVGDGSTTGAAYNGIQVHHDYSLGFYNVSIHDNDIADVFGSCINPDSLDASLGYVTIYNNVCHHAGINRASTSAGSPHSCWAHKGAAAIGSVGGQVGYATNVAIASSVATITGSNGFDDSPQQIIGFGGFGVATALNGGWYSVATSVQASFTVNCSSTSCGNLSSTADSGYFVSAGGVVVTNTAISGSGGTATLAVSAYNSINPLSANEWVTFVGLTAGSCLNGYTAQVLSAGLLNNQIEVTAPSACSTVASTADTGIVQGGGYDYWYNNTCYDSASILNTYSATGGGESSSCGLLLLYSQPSLRMVWTNNVIQNPSYTYSSTANTYICGGGGGSSNAGAGYTQILGTNDLWYGPTGSSTPPTSGSNLTIQTISTTSPGFTSAADCTSSTSCSQNYIPTASSPLNGAGTEVGPVYLFGNSSANLTWDYNGVTRPDPPSMGALEYGSLPSGVDLRMFW